MAARKAQDFVEGAARANLKTGHELARGLLTGFVELLHRRRYFLVARGQAGGGRRKGLLEEAERTAIVAETLYREQRSGVNEIAQRLHISKVTLYKYLRHRGVVIRSYRKATVAKSTD